MTALLILVLLVFMALVVFSLVRGIVAFLKTTKIDLESGDGENVKEMQLMQNRAMFARIKYQGLAVAVIAVILAISQ